VTSRISVAAFLVCIAVLGARGWPARADHQSLEHDGQHGDCAHIPTATLLRMENAGGRWLHDSDGYLRGAELYDRFTGSWATTGSMATPASPYGDAAVERNVLVSVVTTTRVAPSRVELYDAHRAAGATSSMGPRVQHNATLLPRGRCWSVPGSRLSRMPSYTTLPLSCDNGRHGGRPERTLLRFCRTGKCFPGELTTAELYDPSLGADSDGGLNADRAGKPRHFCQREVVGDRGMNGGYLAECRLYDPSTGSWRRRQHDTAALSNSGT